VFIAGQYVFITGQYVFIAGQYVFIAGQYVFNAGQYVFIAGQYVFIAGQYVFIAGQYVFNAGQYVEVARFATLRFLSCLHSLGLLCSCCNVVIFNFDLKACRFALCGIRKCITNLLAYITFSAFSRPSDFAEKICK
jgi:hypothetical protein